MNILLEDHGNIATLESEINLIHGEMKNLDLGLVTLFMDKDYYLKVMEWFRDHDKYIPIYKQDNTMTFKIGNYKFVSLKEINKITRKRKGHVK